MIVKRLVFGALIGALPLSATGYVIFGMVLPSFYTNF
jgi:hypothetical protein